MNNIFKLVVKEEGEEYKEIIYVAANNRKKAERIAILMTADFYDIKTSSLSAESTIMSQKEVNSLNPREFFIYAAIKKE